MKERKIKAGNSLSEKGCDRYAALSGSVQSLQEVSKIIAEVMHSGVRHLACQEEGAGTLWRRKGKREQGKRIHTSLGADRSKKLFLRQIINKSNGDG